MTHPHCGCVQLSNYQDEADRVSGIRDHEEPGAQAVFLLWHSHDLGDGETDDKLIGVYSSEADADAARLRRLRFEGFRDVPEGFRIETYELNRDHWSEGYVTV